MKYLLVLLLVPLLTANKCGKDKKKAVQETENEQQVKDPVPSCIRKIIDDAGKQSVAERPQQIDEYTVSGKRVYLYTAPCCDQYNILLDSNCKEICAPSGGFTGKGDGQCKDFDSTAKHVRLIWKAPSK
jgi:hypothetical protein